MEKTFAYRRHEVVRDAPMVDNLMARWPALFSVSEFNTAFRHITTIPLQSKFLSQLEIYSDSLQRFFQRCGGQQGRKLRVIMGPAIENNDIDTGRDCIIKGICVYMGEDPEELVQEYVGMDDGRSIKEVIENTVVGIYILKDYASDDQPNEIGIVLEGIKVLQDLGSVAFAVAMLFGLMYALNLR